MTTDAFDVPGVDAVFDADLADFVAVRDALVKARKAEGDKEGAAAVKALRKPSTVAWGLNRVARTNRGAIDALVDAGAAVRAAQVKAVQGNDAGELRSASRTWRSQVNELAATVAALVGDQYRDAAASSLEAASIDDALAPILRAGRFTAAVEAAGFGLGGMPEPPPRPSRPVEPAPTAEREPEPEPRRQVDEHARAEAHAALGAQAKRAEQALHRLRRAEQRLDQARVAVDEARAAYQDAEAARDAAARHLAEFDTP